MSRYNVSENDVLLFDEPEKIVSITGLWDVAKPPGDRSWVTYVGYVPGSPHPQVVEPVFLSRPDGAWCQLYQRGTSPDKPILHPEEGPIYGDVIRTDALERRISSLREKEPPRPAAVESTAGRPGQTEGGAASTRMVGGPRLAEWLATEMKQRDRMTINRLYVLSDLDRKTIKKILNGEPVREKSRQKLADGLSKEGPQVSDSDVPSD